MDGGVASPGDQPRDSFMIDRLALKTGSFDRLDDSHSAVVMNTSADLIARSRTGDHEAFRLLFERYARPVMAFTYNLVGRHDVAEELTQETFVRAYSSLKDLRDEARFSTWLFGIGRNVVREWLRAKTRDGGIDTAGVVGVSELQESLDLSPDNQLLGKELNGAIVVALQALDEDRRTVFALKIFHGSSYQEIVEITGFTLAKVKTELHRGRAEMRRRLKGYLETK